MPYVFNPFTGTFDQTGSGGGGISIGDTIGGTPANNGILYADGSDELQADKLRIDSDSYFGGLVTSNSLADQSSASLPKIGFIDASGAGGSFGVGVSTNNTAAVNYLMIDTSSLSAKGQLLYDPDTPANSNFTIAMANGLGGGDPELQISTTAFDVYVPVDMNTEKITAMGDPTDAQDAATKNYVDGLSYVDIDDLLPTQTGHTGKFLTTDGSTTSWATVSASPGGSTTQIQYNSSGSFAGSAYFTWDNTNRIVKVGDPPAFGYAGLSGAIDLYGSGKTTYIAMAAQGSYGSSYGRDEPHIALNTVRISGSGSKVMFVRDGNNTAATISVDKIAANNFATMDNQVTGLILKEQFNNADTAVGIGVTPANTPVAKFMVQAGTANISFSAAMDTLRLKAQTSQTGNLFRLVDTSNNDLFYITQTGALVFNEQGGNVDARFEGDTDANLLFTDASADKVGIGTATPNEKLEVVGTVQADGLRLDLTPTNETITPTHTFTISLNGTNYKVPVVAA